jgi:DNA-binding GntR family transcriptional regulator
MSWKPIKADRVFASLTDQVYGIIRDAIISLELLPGSAIIETELSKAIGTSVTPVREALRRLQSEGLVSSSYARRVHVSGVSISTIIDLYNVRVLLETWAVERSVPKIDEKDIEILVQNIRDAEIASEQNDIIEFTRKNVDFHRTLCNKCGNLYLLKLLDDISDQHFRVRIAMAKRTIPIAKQHCENALEEHWKILDAVRKRDAKQASLLVAKDISVLLNEIESGNLDSISLILNPTEVNSSEI